MLFLRASVTAQQRLTSVWWSVSVLPCPPHSKCGAGPVGQRCYCRSACITSLARGSCVHNSLWTFRSFLSFRSPRNSTSLWNISRGSAAHIPSGLSRIRPLWDCTVRFALGSWDEQLLNGSPIWQSQKRLCSAPRDSSCHCLDLRLLVCFAHVGLLVLGPRCCWTVPLRLHITFEILFRWMAWRYMSPK